jgi:hypothetical protein
MVPLSYYEIRVAGVLPSEVLLDFDRLTASVEPVETVVHGPLTGKERARSPLWAAGKLADYTIGLALDPAPDVVLHLPVAERVHPVRARADRDGAADATHQPAVHRSPGRAALVSGRCAIAAGAGQEALQPHGDQRLAARGRSWRRRLCHQVHIDYFKTEADDPLYKPGEGSLVGQLGAEGGRIRACGDLAVVELRAQRSAGLAAESDLIRR